MLRGAYYLCLLLICSTSSSLDEEFQAIMAGPNHSEYNTRGSPIPGDIPGNSTFEHCRGNYTGDLLDIRWVELLPTEPCV